MLENERVKTDMYFLSINLFQKLTKKVILTDIKMKKMKDKQRQKNNLIANSFTEVILMQSVLIFFLKSIKYKSTLLNQMKKN